MAGSMRYASSYNFDIVKDGRALEAMITYSEGGQPNEKTRQRGVHETPTMSRLYAGFESSPVHAITSRVANHYPLPLLL